MRKLKVRNQDETERKKRISIRKKRIERSDEVMYPYIVEDFQFGFPIRSLLQFHNICKVKKLKAKS